MKNREKGTDIASYAKACVWVWKSFCPDLYARHTLTSPAHHMWTKRTFRFRWHKSRAAFVEYDGGCLPRTFRKYPLKGFSRSPSTHVLHITHSLHGIAVTPPRVCGLPYEAGLFMRRTVIELRPIWSSTSKRCVLAPRTFILYRPSSSGPFISSPPPTARFGSGCRGFPSHNSHLH